MSRGPRRAPSGRETTRHPGRLARVRLALTLAFRWSVREKGRSALIVALIAIPVVGMAGVCLVAPSMMPTTQERLAVELGQMQAEVRVVSGPNDGELHQSPTDISGWSWDGDGGSPTAPESGPVSVLPPGVTAVPLLGSTAVYRTDDGVRALSTTLGEAWDPRFSGRYNVVSGRIPSDPDEIMVTEGALNRLGVRLGGTVAINSPVERTVTVVGVLDARFTADSTEIVFASPATLGKSDIGDDPQASVYLPDERLDWEEVRELNERGALALSRAVAEDSISRGRRSRSSACCCARGSCCGSSPGCSRRSGSPRASPPATRRGTRAAASRRSRRSS